MNKRLLVGSLGIAAIISVGGGYLVSRSDDSSAIDADDAVVMDQPGGVQDPTIGTNAVVQGDRLPVWDLEDNDGNVVTTESLEGQPLVINIWNSTCIPCERELPAFAAVHADVGDRIRFVGVNTLDDADRNRSFAADRGVKYELLRDLGAQFATEVGVAALPVTLFVSADGVILRQTGALEEQDIRDDIAELFPT